MTAHRRWYRYTITGWDAEEWHLEERLSPRVRGRRSRIHETWTTVGVAKRIDTCEPGDWGKRPVWRWIAWLDRAPDYNNKSVGAFLRRCDACRAVERAINEMVKGGGG